MALPLIQYIYSKFFTPFPPCLHLDQICSIKLMQPPLPHLLFHDLPPPKKCGHHIWTLPNENGDCQLRNGLKEEANFGFKV